ncbi:competence protein ComEA [Thermanaeromonas toyohensis ToBE]|uniref:Competence protein ComEA n=2 Tax=Thermanaeromonas TaxID=202949 RepID=A0A1W1VIL6_9FIRM|nr:competence protein ComEA [Thermanaeromonas toyohensis ToBE]
MAGPAVERGVVGSPALKDRPREGEDRQPPVSKGEEFIKIHVAGAVERPGVYQLPTGARVNEALKLAGLLPEADPHALNLAAPLADGQQIIVPRMGEEGKVIPSGPVGSGSSKLQGKVNINTAGLEELDSLPGLGPSLAQRIIEYRQQHGPFQNIEDLQNVPGIGAKRWENLKDLITVR